MNLSKELTDKIYQNFASNEKYRVIENAATKSGLLNSLETRNSHTDNLFAFDIDLTSTKIHNQKQSGRCWIFAGLNVLNFQVNKDYQLEDFEFSESYLYFWDKFEKANNFFHQIIEHSDLFSSKEDEHFRFFLEHPQGDGGHWDMVVALIEKYGLVPEVIYPETVDSESSKDLNFYLNKYLRQEAEVLLELLENKVSQAEIDAFLEQALQAVFNLLAVSLGLPPQEFTYAFRDKNGEHFQRFSGSPLDFSKEFVKLDLADYISLASIPLEDHPYNKSMGPSFMGDVVGGRTLKHLNVKYERLNEAIIQQLKSGEPVFFGCDVLQALNRKSGLLTLDVYDFKKTLDIDFNLTKTQRLVYRDADMSHAIVLVGLAYNDKGQVSHWKVQNSWGDENGDKGYFIATDAWMREHAYNAVINRKFLTAEENAAYDAEPIIYEPWDAVY